MSNFSVVDGDIRLTASGGEQLLHTDDQNRLKVVMDMVYVAHTLSGTDHIGQLTDSQVMVSNVTQHESYIDHDNLLNYEINEHRILNDSLETNINLWSAEKISSEIVTISGKLGDHNELNNLDYASSGHTGFSPTSHNHIESDITDLDKYTVSEVDTISGSLSDEIDSDISTHTAIGDAHHAESHTVASHSDTTATGANLNELVGGGDTTLHIHDNRYYTESEVDTISGSLSSEIDSDISTHSSSADHDGRYYTEAETDALTWVESDITNLDKYTQSEVDNLIASASGTTDHSELDQLDYTSSGHVGFTKKTDFIDGPLSPQVLSGGTVSSGTDVGTFSVSSLTAILRETDSDTGELKYVTKNEEDNIAITVSGTTYFVVLNYNSSTPTISTSETAPNFTQNISIGKVYKNGDDTIHYVSGGYNLSNGVAKLHTRAKSLRKFELDSGSTIAYSGTNNFIMNSGFVFGGLNKYTMDAFDSAVTKFTPVYQDGVGGWTEGADRNTIDYTHYDDGDGTLGNIGNNRYGCHWVYRHIDDGHVYVIYGRDSYLLPAAEAAGEPTKPDHLTDFGLLIGKIIAPQAGGSFTLIQMVSDIFFSGTSVSDHNELGGIDGGTTDEYYHLTSTQHTDLTDGGDTTLHDHDGISENTAARHTRSHTISSTADHTAGNWKLFASNGSGEITEITHGADTYVLTSSGTTSAPTWKAPSGGAGGGLSWTIISSDTNAVKDNGYLINASAGNITLTLPTSPSEGDSIGACDFYNMAETNTITVSGSDNIEGSSSNLIVDVNGSGFTFVYTDATRGWEIISEIGAVAEHNDLSGLQGGTTDEYYHLTSTQHTDLTDGGDTTLHIHDNRYYTESEVDTISGTLQSDIDGKSDTGHAHVASDTTDFSEATDDRVSNLLIAGDNISLDYDDGAGTLTISGSAGGAGADTLLELTDTPSSYSDGLYLKSTTDGTEWATVSGGDGVSSSEDNVWSNNQVYDDNNLTCTSGTTIWNMSERMNTFLSLTCDTTLSGIDPSTDGSAYYTILIQQGGSYTLSFDSAFLTSGGDPLEITTSSGSYDLIGVYVYDSKLFATIVNDFK